MESLEIIIYTVLVNSLTKISLKLTLCLGNYVIGTDYINMNVVKMYFMYSLRFIVCKREFHNLAIPTMRKKTFSIVGDPYLE